MNTRSKACHVRDIALIQLSERNIILRARETHLLKCNAALEARLQAKDERTTINDLPYDCLDRVLAVADETQELKREVAELKTRQKLLIAHNIVLTAREKHLVECNDSMKASVVMERNIILKARETYLLECNAGLKTNETILFECNTSLKARETSLMECNARLRDRLEATVAVVEKTHDLETRNRALGEKLNKTRAAPATPSPHQPRRSGRLAARRWHQ